MLLPQALCLAVSAPWQMLNKGTVEGLFLQGSHDWFKLFRGGENAEPSSGPDSPESPPWAARPGQSFLETYKIPT